MTTGPFDVPVPLDDTEYGGGPGLVDGLDAGHELTASEKLGVVNRGARSGDDAAVVDDATGISGVGLTVSGE